MATVAFHTDTSGIMIGQAVVELASGDSLQASEKGWGATAHAIKAIAEGRGWRHRSHADLFRVVRRLSDEVAQPDIYDLFRVAGGLHINFYEGWLKDGDIAESLTEVGRLLAMLDEAPR